VPELRKGCNRGSPQKHDSETADSLGGAQAPWTSKSGPHRDAQAGRTEVKGTIAPSGCCWAEVRWMRGTRRSIEGCMFVVCVFRFVLMMSRRSVGRDTLILLLKLIVI